MTVVDIELSPWHKRQAALLYHFASHEYLRGLLTRIDALIADAGALLDRRQILDPLMRSQGVAPRDLSANWSTGAFPALVDFREDTMRQIAERAYESYSETGANVCSRMLQEYSMFWAAPDQEAEFREKAEAVFRYAGGIDLVMSRVRGGGDFTFYLVWTREKSLFPQVPRFRIRTDVEAETGHVPPRTGVYVPQDDPYGALQFAWTGGKYGRLIDCRTFSEIGEQAVAAIGRARLWEDYDAMFRFTQRPEYRGVFKNGFGNDLTSEDRDDARSALMNEAFAERPCKWYFVEMLPDQYEAHDGTYAGVSSMSVDGVIAQSTPRTAAGQPCPRTGWWYTPVKVDSKRHFQKGELLPRIDSEFGDTFWIWSKGQS